MRSERMSMWRRAVVAAWSIAAALLSLHCTDASTSVVAPTFEKCQISAATGQSSFSSEGGSGSLAINAARDCTWTVTADAPWVRIIGESSGQGEAALSFSIAANSVPSPRSGAIVVQSQRVEINQAAAPCVIELNQTQKSVPASGERVSIGVTTLQGCSWTAETAANWIVISSGGSGNGSGTVVVSVAPNSGPRRSELVRIAGQIFGITQDAPPPTPAPPKPPTPPPPPPAPPGEGEPVDFDGQVSGRSGQCPNLSFTVGGTHVSADGKTDYRKGRCSDLSNGDRVEIRGTRTSGGGVYATRISFDK